MAMHLTDPTPRPSDRGTPPPLEVAVVHEERGLVLRVAGEIDIATVPLLRAGIDRAVASSDLPVWVDLGGVTFLDSSGIAALVAAHRALEEASRGFGVRNLSPTVRRVFSVTGLEQLLVADP
jgi:anti-sigma B factor antagonist